MWDLVVLLKIGRKAMEDVVLHDAPLHPAKRVRREKRVPPSALDKAMAKIKNGGTEVSLLRTPIEMGMDEKFSDMIDYDWYWPRRL